MTISDHRTLSPDLTEFFESMRRDLATGLVPARVLNDDDLYRLEQDRLFTRVWSFVGHESEIPSPGDYRLRYIGEDAFIFARDEEGEIHVLFNACRHRGTQICRVEKGNTSHFRCPYHGWTYKNTGELVAMPAMRSVSEGLDLAAWSLVSAPHVQSYHGLVFASLDSNAPSFEEYLGDLKYYLDILFVLNDDLDVVGEPARWVMEANWKSGAENFAGDDYHLVYLHRSMFEVDVIQITPSANMLGHHVITGNGHGFSVSVAENPDALAYWGFPEEIVSRYDTGRLSPEQVDLAKRSRVFVGTLFPNLSFSVVPLTANPHDQAPTPFVLLRLWQPRGPRTMELWNWILVSRNASPEFRDLSYKAGMGTLASSGLFDQDDAEPWQSMARTAGSAFGRKVGYKLNYQLGRGVGSAKQLSDWPGPGLASNHRYEEGVQRAIYERWLDYLMSDEYPPSSSTPSWNGSAPNE